MSSSLVQSSEHKIQARSFNRIQPIRKPQMEWIYNYMVIILDYKFWYFKLLNKYVLIRYTNEQ